MNDNNPFPENPHRAETQPPQAPWRQPQLAPQQRMSGGKIALLVGGILLVIALLGTGVFFGARAILNNSGFGTPTPSSITNLTLPSQAQHFEWVSDGGSVVLASGV